MAFHNIDSEIILINQLKSAYRKYKTQIYYDNHSAIQREDLAEFERNNFLSLQKETETFFDNEKIDETFQNLANKIIYNETDDLLDEIEVIAFPKNMKTNESKIISNYNIASNEINQIHYFIKLPVEAQILGVLWILRCGYVLDEMLYKNCYGNRLNKHLLKTLKDKKEWYDVNKKHNFSPFLFEPYYKNYESWRDNALDNIKNLLDNDKHAIMISLDFKNYYYSSTINFDALKNDIERGKNLVDESYPFEDEDTEFNKEINDKLTAFVEEVFKRYYKEFHVNNYFEDLPFIPLGFLPSMIIANWNLHYFDKKILEDAHPSYYGRYVDDILIVLDSHERSEIHKIPHFEEFEDANDIVKKYLTLDSAEHPMNNIFKFEEHHHDFEIDSQEIKLDDEIVKLINNVNFKDKSIIKVHDLKNPHTHDIIYYKNLQIQPNKVKLYKFSHKNSTAVIENFKKEIAKNSSEFKLMKDSDKLIAEFEEKLFEIDYVESINKLNNINSVKINKFEISKLMSGILNSSAFSSETIPEKTVDKLIEAFEANIFEFFTLWEKLFTLLYVNEQEDKLIDLIEYIQLKINSLNFNPENNEYGFKYKLFNDTESDCERVKDTLEKYLFSTIIRVLSLKSSEIYKELFEEEDINEYFDSTFNMIASSMVNNSFMKYPLQNTFKIQNHIRLNSLDEKTRRNIKYDLIKENAGNSNDRIFYGFCYPRYVKLHEIILNEIYNTVYFRKSDEKDFEEKYPDFNQLHSKLNFYGQFSNATTESTLDNYIKTDCALNCNGHEDCPVDENYKTLKVGKDNKTKLKIGLVNTKLDFNDFEKRLVRKPNLKLERFNKIKSQINDAIKSKVDLLLMPEMYIPFEWINEIINISKNRQIGMIFGIEPIISNGYAYNYIITSLPFSVDETYFEAIVSPRLKNYYSPEEIKSIKSQYLNEPEDDKKYYLYNWNGIHIVPFYCYELADIESRAKFKSCCDIITVSEFNKDSIYFANIAESLSRDNYCYCIKSNTSEFGGNSIIQPAKSEMKKIVELKGGANDYLVVQEIDINKLRNNAIKSDTITDKKDRTLKPNPPGLNIDIIKERMNLENKYTPKKFDIHDVPQSFVENETINMLLKRYDSELSNRTFGIWGLSLKPKMKTIESTPALKIVKYLIKEGAKVKVYDPKNTENFKAEIVDNDSIKFVKSKYNVLINADALILLTGWDEFKNNDYNEMKKRMNEKVIFDCRNVLPSKIKDFEVHRIDYGSVNIAF